jgi:hypothetical protein
MGALREVLQKPDPPRASETPYYDRYIGARPTVVTGRGGALCATKEVRGVRFFLLRYPSRPQSFVSLPVLSCGYPSSAGHGRATASAPLHCHGSPLPTPWKPISGQSVVTYLRKSRGEVWGPSSVERLRPPHDRQGGRRLTRSHTLRSNRTPTRHWSGDHERKDNSKQQLERQAGNGAERGRAKAF